MDLKRELLAVLNNPSRFWDSLLENLASEPRICLLTLATCPTPLDIIEWQQAVARVSLDAAVKFEAAIRILDDSFASIGRDGIGSTVVSFRNPSVEEFVAAQLDRNVGFATTVATAEPSLAQVRRLVQLGTATKRGEPREPSYANIHSALIDKPSVLAARLLEFIREGVAPGVVATEASLQLVQLVGQGRLVRMPDAGPVRERLTGVLLKTSFSTHSPFLFKLLDDYRYASTIAIILGNRFDEFYATLVESASSMGHFDSIVNLDQEVGNPPEHASWAEKFHRLNAIWIETEDGEDAESYRDQYEKISDHLDLDDRSGLEAWQEIVEAAEEAARTSHEPEDDSWRESEAYREASARVAARSSQPRGARIVSEGQLERARIDALFGGLSQSKSRE